MSKSPSRCSSSQHCFTNCSASAKRPYDATASAALSGSAFGKSLFATFTACAATHALRIASSTSCGEANDPDLALDNTVFKSRSTATRVVFVLSSRAKWSRARLTARTASSIMGPRVHGKAREVCGGGNRATRSGHGSAFLPRAWTVDFEKEKIFPSTAVYFRQYTVRLGTGVHRNRGHHRDFLGWATGGCPPQPGF